MRKIKKLFNKFIHSYLSTSKAKDTPFVGSDAFSNLIIDLYKNSNNYYTKEDLIYFPSINAYVAFKYNVVKDIFLNRTDIGVSEIHLALNDIYFSIDESKHTEHKKSAIKHLDFLSKRHQPSHNDFITRLLHKLILNLPKNEPVNLEYYIVNPIIFLNSFSDFGILEIFPEFDPDKQDFELEKTIKKVDSFFNDMDNLIHLFKEHFDNGGIIPEKSKPFLDDIYELDASKDQSLRLAFFFKSMIFSAVDSTTSFLRSMIYIILTKYPNIFTQDDYEVELYTIAEESLRIYTPVPFVYRTVKTDIVYNNTHLKTGDLVLLCVAAANNDPSVYNSPSEFILNREVKHLSFGRGAYACIGESMSHRLVISILCYLSKHLHQFELIDKDVEHKIENSMLKIQLKVIFNAK